MLSLTIMERINQILENAGGEPTGAGGSIVDKLNQIVEELGGDVHPAATIEEVLDQLDELGFGGSASEVAKAE